MATTETFDLERCAAAISDENPVGPDIADGRLGIKNTRRVAQKTESKYRNAWDRSNPDLDKPDWGPTLQVTTDFVATRSKDLWVLAWLAEAALRVHGYAGLRDSFRLMRRLVEQYWEIGLNPQPDPNEDGIAGQLSQVSGLNDALPIPIKESPLTEPGGYSFIDYLSTDDFEKLVGEDREKALNEGGISRDMIQVSVGRSSPDYFVNLYQDMIECKEEIGLLTAALDERCGVDAPSFGSIVDAIDECQRLLVEIAPPGVLDFTESEEGTEDTSEGSVTAVAGSAASGAFGSDGGLTRESAFQSLEKVAKFFEKTEPHSPVSFALRKALRWGRMPLDTWLSEMLQERTEVKDDMFRLLGIEVKRDEESSPGE